MKASRLLAMLLLLSSRGRVSAADLARELEVSLRTVYRDVDALSAAGVPVYATRGRHGGIALMDGYRTRLTGLTGLSGDEARSLSFAGVPRAAADLGLGGVLAASQVKLLAGLPADLRERPDPPPAGLATVADAVWSQRRLDVRYERSRRDVVERVLDPLGLVLKTSTWYLVAAAGGGPPRTYRVSRVQAATVRDETFDRPSGFDLDAFWQCFLRDYAERVYRARAEVRLDETGRSLLFLLGDIPAREGRAAMTSPDAAGWSTTSVPIESVRHAVPALLQLGEHVEVLGPPELRDAVADAARRTAARYER